MTPEEKREIIAALTQIAKALEIERACVLRVVAVLKRGDPQGTPIVLSSNDSVAGIIPN